MNYTITPVPHGPFTRYQLRRGAEYIGEFPTLAQCEAMRDASERAGSDDFMRGYIEALYFTDTGEPEQPPHDAQLSTDALLEIAENCADFQRLARLRLEHAYATHNYDAAQAGRDFWLTRNRHGAGFWDRGLGAVGDDLTRDAHGFSERNAYIGDDGLIYLE